MGRPRKNRIGEYAAAWGEELGYQLQREVLKAVEESQDAYRAELSELKREIRRLSKQVEELSRRGRAGRPKVGKWVPGGPGRPPKDAEERIAAFTSRSADTKSTTTRRKSKKKA